MSNQLRFQVVEEAFKKKALEVPTPAERPSEYFGKYVFNRQKMFKYLPAEVYRKMIDLRIFRKIRVQPSEDVQIPPC